MGAASLKLSQLLDVPNCDVYRVGEDEDLACITSVCEGEWHAGYLGRRVKPTLWATDREALRTRRPVLISSPDDPRLDESERTQMLSWNAQATAVVPMVVKNEAIGLVELGETREGHTITPDQTATAESICQLHRHVDPRQGRRWPPLSSTRPTGGVCSPRAGRSPR